MKIWLIVIKHIIYVKVYKIYDKIYKIYKIIIGKTIIIFSI